MNGNETPASPLARIILNIAAALLPPVRRLKAAHEALQQEVAQARLQHEQPSTQAYLYQALFEQTQDAIAIFDLNGACTAVNQRCCEMLGYDAQELIGVVYGDLSVDADAARRTFQRIVGGETMAQYERIFRHKDGHEIFTETSTTLVYDDRGQPLHVQAIIRDVTSRRQAEDEVARYNHLLQTLIDNLPDYIYFKERDGRILITNGARARSLGLKRNEIVGMTVEDLFPPERAKQYREEDRQILATGEPMTNQEELVVGPDDQPTWLLTNKIPLRDSHGEIVGLLGVTRDITSRKLREKQLEDNQRFIAKVTEAIPDVVYVYDFEAEVYRYYNEAAVKRILGYSEDEFRRADQSFMMSIMHPDDRYAFEKWFDRFMALKDDEVLETRYRLQRSDGSWRRFYSRDQVFARNADGLPYQSLGIAQDVTDTEITDQQLRRQNEYLRALSEVTPAVVNRFDSNDILNVVINRTKALMQTDYVYMEMVAAPSDEMPGYIHIQRFGGHDYFVKPGEGVVGQVYVTSEIVVVGDYSHWPHRVNASKLSDVRASIGVPLKSGDRIVGVLGVSYTDRERIFDKAEIEILTRLVDLASIALDNAQLFAAAQRELSERIRVERALRASEERYRTVIESQTELVARFLPDLTLSFVNNAYCRFFRLAPSALVGHSFERLVAVEDRQRLRAHLDGLTRNHPAQTAEFRFRRPDGVLRWLQCSNRAVFDQNGRITEYQMVGRDVTEQRQIEEALRLSEARYRAVVQSQTEFILRFSRDNKVTFVNDAYCRYFALKADDILGKVLPHRIVPEDWMSMEPRLNAQFRGELEVATYVHRVFAPNGEMRWQQWTDRVIFDEQGGVKEIQAVGRDITEQKQAEIALNAERDFVAAILENTVALLTVADRDGRIVSFNRACEALSGYALADMEGEFFWDRLLLPEEASQVKQIFAEVNAGQFPNQNVNHWVARDGTRYLIEWSNTALTDENGRVTHIVSSGIDVSARQQLEERSLELAVEREKVKILGNFIRDASHDFRTPLSILNTNLYLLRKFEGADAYLPRLEEMEQQVVHLTRLIDQLLTMTRLDSGADIKLSTVQVNDLVQNVCASMYNSITQKHLTLDRRLAESLPAIKADAWHLNQALRNVLVNAVQYTPDGGSITVETTVSEAGVAICVSDTGVGIDAGDLPHVFERFYRADKARSTGEAGTGLGLSITRKIVELHNGTVSVDSTPGERTTFTLTLPTQVIALNGQRAH